MTLLYPAVPNPALWERDEPNTRVLFLSEGGKSEIHSKKGDKRGLSLGRSSFLGLGILDRDLAGRRGTKNKATDETILDDGRVDG